MTHYQATHLRRRDEVVAWRYPGGEAYQLPDWLAESLSLGHAGARGMCLDTLVGNDTWAAPGDWIVWHPVGESAGFLVLSHREFTVLYEHVEKTP